MKPSIHSFVLALFVATINQSLAANKTWDGGALPGDNTWGNGTNWSGDIAPVNADSLSFAAANATVSTVNNIASLTLNSTGTGSNDYAYRIENGNFTNSGSAVTVNGRIRIDAGTSEIAHDLVFGTGGTGLGGIEKRGGTLTISGNISETVATSLLSSYGGTLRLTGTNTFSGNVSLANGITEVGSIANAGLASALGTGGNGSLILIGATTNNPTLRHIGSANATTDRQVVVGYTNNSTGGAVISNTGNGTLTFSNSTFNLNAAASGVTSNQTRKIEFQGTNTGANEVQGVIQDNDTANGGLIKVVKNGPGTWIFSGNNTYSGGTQIYGGTTSVLRVAHNNALGTGSVELGNITNRGTLELADGINIANSLTVVEGAASQTDPTTIRLRSGAAAGTYSGNITNSLTKANMFALDAAANGTLTVTGVISGSGASGLRKTGAGTVVLPTDNTYTGNTTVSTGTLKITHNNALGSTANGTTVANNAVLELDGSGGDLTLAEALAINGSGETINGPGALTSSAGNNTVSATVTLGSAAQITAAAGTLVLDAASGNAIEGTNVDLQFDPNGGTIVVEDAIALGTGGIEKRWTGNLTLNGTSTFSGRVKLNNGNTYVTALKDAGIASPLGTGATDSVIQFGSATATGQLYYTGSGDVTNRQIQIGSGNTQTGGAAIRSFGSGALTFSNATFNVNDATLTGTPTRILTLGGNNTGNNTISGVIADNSSANGTAPVALTKGGLGKWILAGNNTYTGETAVTDGTLIVNGDQSAATGTVSVAAFATLGGNGTIGGNTTIQTNGRLTFDLNTGNATHDSLAVIGSLTFAGSSNLTISSSGGATTGNYTLVTTTGISGPVPTIVSLPAGWGANATFSGTNLVLVVTSTGGSTYAAWAAANAPGQSIDQDHDLDGVRNGIEYFMGESGSGFTTHPGVVGGKVSWPKDPGYTGSYGATHDYVVQTSPDLVNWSNVAVADPNLSNSSTLLEYTLPTTDPKLFVRLKVTGP